MRAEVDLAEQQHRLAEAEELSEHVRELMKALRPLDTGSRAAGVAAPARATARRRRRWTTRLRLT